MASVFYGWPTETLRTKNPPTSDLNRKSELIFAGMMTYIPNSPDMHPDESLHYARMAVMHARSLITALEEIPQPVTQQPKPPKIPRIILYVMEAILGFLLGWIILG